MARIPRKITVICNYPEDIDKFQDIMCNALARALVQCKSPGYIEALKEALRRQIDKEEY